MSWVRLDDQFPDHPKVVAAGPQAAWLHVCALCYCGRYLTDGLIPKAKVRTLTDLPKPLQLAAKLVDVGLWAEVGDSYEIHDYLTYNPTRAKVEAEREAGASRQAKSRARRGVTGGVTSRDPSPSPLSTTSRLSFNQCSPQAVDDDEGFWQEACRSFARCRLSDQPVGKVNDPQKWLETATRNALEEQRDAGRRYCWEFDLTAYELGEVLAGRTSVLFHRRRDATV